MNVTELLNSDLSTITRELRRGYDWWLDELAALVPQSVRSWRSRARTILLFDGQRGFEDAAGGLIDSGSSVRSLADTTILIRTHDALIRTISTPHMTRTDLDRMLSLNIERYFPVPGGSVLLASARHRDASEDATMRTDVAAIPLSIAQCLTKALQHADMRPRSIRIAQGDRTPDPRFEFLPAMRAAGLVTSRTANHSWWILVGVLAALNLATAIWRDSADVDRLQALADTQRPAVAVAQRMAAQMRSANAVANRTTARRRLHNPLADLAHVTAAIPDGAWVQRYAWDGQILRLTGYRSRDTDVAGALRKIPGFANVKSAQTDSIAETATGQPFDLVAEIGKR